MTLGDNSTKVKDLARHDASIEFLDHALPGLSGLHNGKFIYSSLNVVRSAARRESHKCSYSEIVEYLSYWVRCNQ